MTIYHANLVHMALEGFYTICSGRTFDRLSTNHVAGFLFSLRVARTNSPSGKRALVSHACCKPGERGGGAEGGGQNTWGPALAC